MKILIVRMVWALLALTFPMIMIFAQEPERDYAIDYGLIDNNPCDDPFGPAPPSECNNDSGPALLAISLISAGIVGGVFFYSKKQRREK